MENMTTSQGPGTKVNGVLLKVSLCDFDDIASETNARDRCAKGRYRMQEYL